ncbi:hypothetical protein EDEG_03817 [Edhazardia aedis USNM 41457]|uniref:ORC1/DEAH AAA+ ATPase domain-containing protein n=1 Tax=Edhazardia aedis (strain USNM 41457) TaxID=1003232 RepID=J9DJW8_EDHAE|nr:hypothetical protein EDEG_03817 [Edhazardia aedis USNM 41457]|eukprot:EJW01642.1 hypothetical protein EDEG_03817 [Edhazardia aedis USNM 41457]
MTVPCRENEYLKIKNIVNKYLKDGISTILHMTGVPGSGKTYTTLKTLVDVDYSYVNCNNIKQKTHVYSKIFRKLCCVSTRKNYANHDILIQHLTNCKKPHIILLDEVDLLYTRIQNHLYAIYEIPYKQDVSILLITISNTFSFVLDGKITSRLGSNLIRFEPYKSTQLMKIIDINLQKENEKNSKTHIFVSKKWMERKFESQNEKNKHKKDNLTSRKKHNELTTKELISRRIAAVSGDARKAINLYKECKEHDIRKADDLMAKKTQGLLSYFLNDFNSTQKRFLFSINERKGVIEAFSDYVDLCTLRSKKPINFIEFQHMLDDLERMGIIGLDKNCVYLKYLKEEINQILQSDLDYIKQNI